MVNNVVVAGILEEDPQRGRDGCRIRLQIEKEDPKRERKAVSAYVYFSGKQADLVAQHMKRGRSCVVDGFLGEERGELRVFARRFEFGNWGPEDRKPQQREDGPETYDY